MGCLSVQTQDPPLCEARPLWSEARARRHRTGRRALQRLCDVALIATAAAFAVPVGELIAASRRSTTAAFARQSAMISPTSASG